MRNLVFVLALALGAAALEFPQVPPSAGFDPVGKWTFATRDDAGAPITGTMEISGKPGTYGGILTSAPDRTLQINDVLTSPNGMVVIANLTDGGVAVIKVWKGTDGKLQGGWGPIRSVIPATVERAK